MTAKQPTKSVVSQIAGVPFLKISEIHGDNRLEILDMKDQTACGEPDFTYKFPTV